MLACPWPAPMNQAEPWISAPIRAFFPLQLGCAVIAGLLHYLFLACFAWMFLEAVVLFLTVRNLGVVNYFSTRSLKTWQLSLFGYGFPALVVAVSAAVVPEGYGRQEK